MVSSCRNRGETQVPRRYEEVMTHFIAFVASKASLSTYIIHMAPVFHEAFKASNFKASGSVIYGKLAAERTIVTNPQPWPSASTGSLHRSPSFAAPTAQHAPKLYNDGQGSPVGLYFPKGDTGTHMVRTSLGHTQDGEGRVALSQDPQYSQEPCAGSRARRSRRPTPSPQLASPSLFPPMPLSVWPRL